jgi:exosortase A-associated hydrolase 1
VSCAVTEVPVSIPCQGAEMIGVLHAPTASPRVGVVVVVGGPQYRVGSHRQFLLLGRDLASRGAAVLRFDCRGMGDSDGEFPGFERIEPDIAAAVDFMLRKFDSIRKVVLWGLCDATTAICEHARHDPRIDGVVMVNPWVRTEVGHAQAQLRHYYLGRIAQREFLHKILRGEFRALASTRELFANLGRVLGALLSNRTKRTSAENDGSLVEQMGGNLRHYRGLILLILSGRDLTAKEFDAAARQSKPWRMILSDKRLTRRELTEADHTFSRRIWRDQVAEWTSEWMRTLP